MKTFRTIFVLSGTILLLIACRTSAVKAPTPLPAGFVNSYDATTYDALATSAATINAAKARFGSNAQAKAPLNAAITAYMDAKVAYLKWHDAAMLNPATDHSAVDQLLNVMLAAVAVINQQFAVPAPAKTSLTGLPDLEAL